MSGFNEGDRVYDEHLRRVGRFELYTGDGYAQVRILDGTGDVYYPPVEWLRPAAVGDEGS